VISQYKRPTRLNLLSLQVLSLQAIALANLYQQPKRVVLTALSFDIEYTPANPPINKVEYHIITHYKFHEIHIQLAQFLTSKGQTYCLATRGVPNGCTILQIGTIWLQQTFVICNHISSSTIIDHNPYYQVIWLKTSSRKLTVSQL
jgi:hypothetical protein